MVLSIFDQSRKSEGSQQILDINEGDYKCDADMMHIVHRLLAAAADTEVRHSMNVEDEYYSIIEKRDTTIMQMDRRLAEATTQLEEKKTQLEEKKTQLHSSIKLLLEMGMPPERIATQLDIDIQTVRDLMS